MTPGSTPSSAAIVAAASALSRLNRPPSGDVACATPRHVNVVPRRRRPPPSTASVGPVPDRRDLRRRRGAGGRAGRRGTRPPGRPGSGSNSRALASKYASIVPWKSRWSWLRFVNPATANRVPSTRCCARAWDDTSIATAAPGAGEARPAGPGARAPRGWCAARTACRSPRSAGPTASKIDAEEVARRSSCRSCR